MSDSDSPLTQRQMQLMAYVDDEMPAQERTEFEQQLAQDSDLAAEVAEFRRLEDITKALQLAEPSDHEIHRFWESFYNRSEWRLGWILFTAGLAVLGAWGLSELLGNPDLHAIAKLAIVAALFGSAILFWNVLRIKLRTHRLDRYRGVIR
ncbi:MAG: hypothetical protein VX951_03850 [Planctomycetota bacterium]|nr:hypothetical protein [Planctomycetota bacterium]